MYTTQQQKNTKIKKTKYANSRCCLFLFLSQATRLYDILYNSFDILHILS